MAKRKRSKSESQSSFQYSIEMTGLLLVLIGIIGFGFGVVGAFIKKFAMFLVGEWWPLILLFIIYVGFKMVFNRKRIKFFSTKYVGFYLLVIVILVLSHYTFIREDNTFKGVIELTKDKYMERISTISGTGPILSSGQSDISVGGGFIGAMFSGVFVQLFSLMGTIIVVVCMGIVGLILLFNINFPTLIERIKELLSKTKDIIVEDNEDDYEDDDEEEDFKEDNRVVITSVEELKSHNNVQEELQQVIDYTEEDNSTHPYKLPSIEILDKPKKDGKVNSNEFIRSNQSILERVLSEFGIQGQVVEIHVGPAVTQYEVSIKSGTKVSRIVSLNKEIALALAAKDVRIEAPIPGKSTIGVEIPNQVIAPVKIREILGNIPESQKKANIIAALGKDIMGRVQTADISKMPHLLVAGATGSGKSVCINSIIASILMKYRPDEVKLVLIDPKKVELSNYNGVPHLMSQVVTDPKKASAALQKLVQEMEKRYDIFEERAVKNINGYNEMIDKENQKHPDNKQKRMPYIVAIIDELADLMVVAAKDVEDSIMRITQMARAAGIHLIVATQRPSTDVITGVVKANIPSRISFAVSSQIDSRTILDHSGAEKLLGKGDMLYLPMGENAPIRIQGCFISDDEIRKLIEHVKSQQEAKYDESFMQPVVDDHNPVSSDREEYDDPLYDQIVEFAVSTGKISASLLQRKFRLGYNRAARVVDLLEERGIVGPANGSKPREVLVKLDSKEE